MAGASSLVVSDACELRIRTSVPQDPWVRHDNFCVSSGGDDVKETPAGQYALDDCKAMCEMNFQCSAVEFYQSGWFGSTCFHILDAVPAAAGDTGPQHRDAECHVKSDGPPAEVTEEHVYGPGVHCPTLPAPIDDSSQAFLSCRSATSTAATTTGTTGTSAATGTGTASATTATTAATAGTTSAAEAGATATTTTTAAASTATTSAAEGGCGGIYEAEHASRSGGIVEQSDRAGYSGSGYMDFVAPSGEYIEWLVEPCASGFYELKFTYALAQGDRPLELVINSNTEVASLSFPESGSWATWGDVVHNVRLLPGSNTIKLKSIGLSGANVDRLTVTAQGGSCPRPSDWCYHAGGTYTDSQDCDGDGVADPQCHDTADAGFIGSASGCSDTWPDGGCQAASTTATATTAAAAWTSATATASPGAAATSTSTSTTAAATTASMEEAAPPATATTATMAAGSTSAIATLSPRAAAATTTSTTTTTSIDATAATGTAAAAATPAATTTAATVSLTLMTSSTTGIAGAASTGTNTSSTSTTTAPPYVERSGVDCSNWVEHWHSDATPEECQAWCDSESSCLAYSTSRGGRCDACLGSTWACDDPARAQCNGTVATRLKACANSPPDWADPFQNTCDVYAANRMCSLAGWHDGDSDGSGVVSAVSALEACCACGGGTVASQPLLTPAEPSDASQRLELGLRTSVTGIDYDSYLDNLEEFHSRVKAGIARTFIAVAGNIELDDTTASTNTITTTASTSTSTNTNTNTNTNTHTEDDGRRLRGEQSFVVNVEMLPPRGCSKRALFRELASPGLDDWRARFQATLEELTLPRGVSLSVSSVHIWLSRRGVLMTVRVSGGGLSLVPDTGSLQRACEETITSRIVDLVVTVNLAVGFGARTGARALSASGPGDAGGAESQPLSLTAEFTVLYDQDAEETQKFVFERQDHMRSELRAELERSEALANHSLEVSEVALVVDGVTFCESGHVPCEGSGCCPVEFTVGDCPGQAADRDWCRSVAAGLGKEFVAADSCGPEDTDCCCVHRADSDDVVAVAGIDCASQLRRQGRRQVCASPFTYRRPIPCMKLWPVPDAACPSGAVGLESCDLVLPGELCDGDGECSTNGALDNCGVHDVYRKFWGSCWRAVSPDACPCTADDPMGCDLQECTADMSVDELCEAHHTALPDGQHFEVDNCPGERDVWQRTLCAVFSCSVADGSDISAEYPCSCGDNVCSTGYICNASANSCESIFTTATTSTSTLAGAAAPLRPPSAAGDKGGLDTSAALAAAGVAVGVVAVGGAVAGLVCLQRKRARGTSVTSFQEHKLSDGSSGGEVAEQPSGSNGSPPLDVEWAAAQPHGSYGGPTDALRRSAWDTHDVEMRPGAKSSKSSVQWSDANTYARDSIWSEPSSPPAYSPPCSPVPSSPPPLLPSALASSPDTTQTSFRSEGAVLPSPDVEAAPGTEVEVVGAGNHIVNGAYVGKQSEQGVAFHQVRGNARMCWEPEDSGQPAGWYIQASSGISFYFARTTDSSRLPLMQWEACITGPSSRPGALPAPTVSAAKDAGVFVPAPSERMKRLAELTRSQTLRSGTASAGKNLQRSSSFRSGLAGARQGFSRSGSFRSGLAGAGQGLSRSGSFRSGQAGAGQGLQRSGSFRSGQAGAGQGLQRGGSFRSGQAGASQGQAGAGQGLQRGGSFT